MDFKNSKWLPFGWVVATIGSGFFNGIGTQFWSTIQSVITNSPNTSPITFQQILQYIALGFVVFSVPIWWLSKIKTSRGNQTPEYKLMELIGTIKIFIKKWNKNTPPFLVSSYRTQILGRTIWNQKPEKILEHSILIKRKIATVSELQIKNASSVLKSLTKISNDMSTLGSKIEMTVMTLRQEEEALAKDPKVFNNFVSDGDKICDDLKLMLIELEKLRTDVLKKRVDHPL